MAERFWRHVDVRGEDECWLWRGGRHDKGYGLFHGGGASGYEMVRATWMAWFLKTGERPPKNLNLLHHCDNPPCVNPKHLYVGTQSANITECCRKGRSNLTIKLTAVDVAEIYRLCRDRTMRQRDIANLYGISQGNVSAIFKGTTWREVPRPVAA